VVELILNVQERQADMARILVVEGHDVARWALANLLRSAGHQVEQAADGLQALQRFAAHPFDAVLMDVHLPHMDGLEACRRLRQESEVPILMTAAHRDPEVQEQALSSGATAFLSKPMEFEGLLSWVQVMILWRELTNHNSPSYCPS
jgi:CheY-like chemotaxis protein